MTEVRNKKEDFQLAGEEEIHLQDYLKVFLRRWQLIVALMLTVFSGVAVFTLFQKPIYEAFATIEIRKSTKGGMLDALGLESANNLSANIQTLQSRSMAENVAQRLNLHWQLAATTADGLDITLREFKVADDSTVFELLLTGPDSFRVLQDGREVATGRNGELLKREGLELLVDMQRGKNGDRLRLERIPLYVAGDRVLKAIRAVEVGRGTNIVRISAQSTDPQLARDMVNQLTQIYQEENSAQKSREAGKAVDFIDQQLIGLRDRLNHSEQRLKDYKIESGLISLGPDGSNLVDKMVEIERQKAHLDVSVNRIHFAIDELKKAMATRKPFSPPIIEHMAASDVTSRLNDLETEKKALLAEFTEAHPAVIEVEQKLRRSQEALLSAYKSALSGLENDKREYSQRLAGYDVELKRVPEAELELVKMTRDNKVNAELYTFLLQKQQEASIAQASTISNIEIIDPAFTPLLPIKPNKMKNFALGAVLGLMLGVGAAFFLEYMDQTVKDAEGAQRALGIPVIGTIPRFPLLKTKKNGKGRMLLSSFPPRSAPVEAFRSLRTGIHFAAVGEAKKVIMVTSALPGEGKSTISANIALVMAKTGAKVLLIGCDLRRPTLSETFGVPNAPGLSDLLSGDQVKAFRHLEKYKIDFLSGGTIPPNPSEILGSTRMHKLLTAMRERYDYIILDAPPVLPVTDAMILAPEADMVLVVLETCRVPFKAVKKMREDLIISKAPLIGVVLNDKTGKGFQHYGGYSYYNHKEYGSYYADDTPADKLKART